MSETNGTTETTETPAPAKPSPLIAIRAQYEANGGDAKRNIKAAKELAAQFLKDKAAVDAAEKAVDAARAKWFETCRKLMTATGAIPLTMGGTLYNPSTSKGGENVFYRPAGTRTSLELG